MAAFFSGFGPKILTVLASVFVFGVVIFIHELGHFLAAKLSGITVNEFSIGMGPTLFCFSRGGTKYALRLLPIGGFVSMEGEDEESEAPGAFAKASVLKRIVVTVAGAFMNLVLGFAVLVGIVSSQDLISTRTVANFYEGAATQMSGLQAGDTIVGVNGRRCFIANDLIYELARTQEGRADLVVLRNGERVCLDDVKFDTNEVNGSNQLVIDFQVLGEKKSIPGVLKEAWNWTISIGRTVMLSLSDLLTGRVAINMLSGPVGIVSAISDATSAGLRPLLLLLAFITVNLGIFNLLPIPALDGGRLIFLLAEALFRKQIKQKYEIIINAVGFILLFGLMIFATFNDITRLIQ